MGTKARVQDDGRDSGHAQVAVYTRSGGTGWALLGHLRPRTGAETEQTVRDLADGMAVEDHRGAEIAQDGPRRSMTVDDVAAVCAAAGLERTDRKDWADAVVSVEAVTTSCAPIGPGDERPFVGIFVWNLASDRREDLTRHCSPTLLRAVIDDVRAYPGE